MMFIYLIDDKIIKLCKKLYNYLKSCPSKLKSKDKRELGIEFSLLQLLKAVFKQ